MKKVLLTAVVSALLVASCSQEEVVENVSNPQLNTFNDEMKWGQGYANVLVNKLAPQTVVAKRVENAKSSYNTDDGIFKLAPEGQFVYGAATGYFDCYKNDVSGEEHYKCHFILN